MLIPGNACEISVFNALQNARRFDWFAIGDIKDFFHAHTMEEILYITNREPIKSSSILQRIKDRDFACISRYEHIIETHSTAFCFCIMTVSWLVLSFMLNNYWRHIPCDILTDRRITDHFSLALVQKFQDPH